MGQTEIIVHVIQGHLLPQPVCALAERADPSPDRGDMLADAEVEPLYNPSSPPNLKRQKSVK